MMVGAAAENSGAGHFVAKPGCKLFLAEIARGD